MAEGSIMLHISAAKLDERINALGDRMTELKGISDDYKALNDRVTDFMGKTDDNFEKMRENVRQNIEMVGKAYTIAKRNQEQLQSELRSLQGLQEAVGSTLDTGVTTAKNVVNLISVASDLDF